MRRASLTAPSDDELGASVAAIDDIVLVGAPLTNGSDARAQHIGAVYLLDLRSGALLARVVAPTPLASAHFGSATAIAAVAATASSSGRYQVLVGAPRDATRSIIHGSAYVFTLETTASSDGGATTANVSLAHRLEASELLNITGSHFGCAVALSRDGRRAAVGARGPERPPAGDWAAHVYGKVYIFDVASGAQHATLSPVDDGILVSLFPEFGASTARAPCIGEHPCPHRPTHAACILSRANMWTHRRASGSAPRSAGQARCSPSGLRGPAGRALPQCERARPSYTTLSTTRRAHSSATGTC